MNLLKPLLTDEMHQVLYHEPLNYVAENATLMPTDRTNLLHHERSSPGSSDIYRDYFNDCSAVSKCC